MKKDNRNRLIIYSLVALIVIILAIVWWNSNDSELPDGFAVSNGRIEATEIDISTKIAGRIDEIFVNEGDFVTTDQVLAQMDTRTLDEQRLEAEAQIRQAQSAVSTAESLLAQRKSEKASAEAFVKQREAEYSAAQKRLKRSKTLVNRGATSEQQLDDDQAQASGTLAALEASHAQVMASQAAIDSAMANIIQAKTKVEAAQATERRIAADIDDGRLKAPRNGRIQYRVAEPGEVLGGGGRVLNMVDLSDVYMTFFLSTEDAGKIALGSDVHIILDAAPDMVIPARATYVASVAQFTPKTVETDNERLKLMFRIKARIEPALLEKHIEYVKTGLPGKAYVRLDNTKNWPDKLMVRVQQ